MVSNTVLRRWISFPFSRDVSLEDDKPVNVALSLDANGLGSVSTSFPKFT
jgi:hypothetical protein